MGILCAHTTYYIDLEEDTMQWWHVLLIIVGAFLCLGIGAAIGYYYRRNIAEAKTAKAEDAVRKMIEEDRAGEGKQGTQERSTACGKAPAAEGGKLR